jgi:hypothetical protein
MGGFLSRPVAARPVEKSKEFPERLNERSKKPSYNDCARRTFCKYFIYISYSCEFFQLAGTENAWPGGREN